MGPKASAVGPTGHKHIHFILRGGSFFCHILQVEILHGKQWPTTGACHKLISQSAVSFGPSARLRITKAYDVTSTKKGSGDDLAKLSKVLRQASWDYMVLKATMTLKLHPSLLQVS